MLAILAAAAGCAHAAAPAPADRVSRAAESWLEDAPETARLEGRSPPRATWLRALVASDRGDDEALLEAARALLGSAPDARGALGAAALASRLPLEIAQRDALAIELERAARRAVAPEAKLRYLRLRLRLAPIDPATRRRLLEAVKVAQTAVIEGPLGPLGLHPPPRETPPGAITREVGARGHLPVLSNDTPGAYRIRVPIPGDADAAWVATPGPSWIRTESGPERALPRGIHRLALPPGAKRLELLVHAAGEPGPAVVFGRAAAPDPRPTPLTPAADRYAEARLELLPDGGGPRAARAALEALANRTESARRLRVSSSSPTWSLEALADRTESARGAPLHLLWARVLEARRYPAGPIEEALRRAAAADPAHPGVRLELAARAVEQSPAAALEHLAPLGPSGRALALRLRAYEAAGDAPATIAAARALLFTPAARDARDAAARAVRRLGQLSLALRLEDRADEGEPRLRAERAAARGELARAAALFRRAIETRWSERARALSALAELALRGGDAEAALAHAEAALRLDPRAEEALRIALRVALLREDAVAAEAALARLEASGAAELEDRLGFEALAPRSALEARFPLRRGPLLERWSGASSVLLLDRIVDRVRPDGRVDATRTLIRRIQSEEAAEAHEELELEGMGAVILDLATKEPTGERRPAERPAGTDTWAFASVDPGDELVARWRALEPAASALGGYVRTFFFGAEVPLARAEWVVTIPPGLAYRTKSFHGAPAPTVHEDEAGQTVLHFAQEAIAPFPPAALSPAVERYVPFAAVWVGFDETALRRSRDLAERTPPYARAPLESAARRIVGEAGSPYEAAQRLLRWILDEIAEGPERAPDITLDVRRGDRERLFVALAEAIGVPAELALVHPGAAAPALFEVPSPARFPLRAVRLAPAGASPEWVRLDGGAPVVGPLPRAFCGGLWRPVGGRARPLTREDCRAPPTEVTVHADVRLDGRAEGRLVATLHGDRAASVRARWRATSLGDRARLAATWLSALLPGASLVRGRVAGDEKPWDPLVIELELRHPALFERRADRLVSGPLLEVPLAERAVGATTLAELLEAAAERDVPLALPAFEARTGWILRFPGGVETSAHPRDLTMAGGFGLVSQRFEGSGRKRRLVRVRSSPGAVIGPAAAAALAVSLSDAAAALAQPLELRISRSAAR